MVEDYSDWMGQLSVFPEPPYEDVGSLWRVQEVEPVDVVAPTNGLKDDLGVVPVRSVTLQQFGDLGRGVQEFRVLLCEGRAGRLPRVTLYLFRGVIECVRPWQTIQRDQLARLRVTTATRVGKCTIALVFENLDHLTEVVQAICAVFVPDPAFRWVTGEVRGTPLLCFGSRNLRDKMNTGMA